MHSAMQTPNKNCSGNVYNTQVSLYMIIDCSVLSQFSRFALHETVRYEIESNCRLQTCKVQHAGYALNKRGAMPFHRNV